MKDFLPNLNHPVQCAEGYWANVGHNQPVHIYLRELTATDVDPIAFCLLGTSCRSCINYDSSGLSAGLARQLGEHQANLVVPVNYHSRCVTMCLLMHVECKVLKNCLVPFSRLTWLFVEGRRTRKYIVLFGRKLNKENNV